MNLSKQKHIIVKRATDIEPRTFHTYILPDQAKDIRLRIDVVAHPLLTHHSLLGARKKPETQRQAIQLVKKIHRFSHATDKEMQALYKRHGEVDPLILRAIATVYSACEICAANGRPRASRKVSLSHIDTSLNMEVQIDFLWCTIGGAKLVVLNITDCHTSYSEMAIANNRSAETIIRIIEVEWIYRHGAPSNVSADPELDNVPLKTFFKRHSITYKPRPAQRHNKVGIFERKNETFKRILAKLDCEQSSAPSTTIFARAVFLSNLFSGSKLLSSFELARGYLPSVLGLPQVMITTEILQAYKEQIATRALQRLLSSHTPHNVLREALKPGTII